MKTSLIVPHFRHCALALVLSAGAILPTAQANQILPLEFKHGGSSSADVRNQVDAWEGMAGDGWLTKWTSKVNSPANLTRSVEIIDSNPLAAGKNYLKFTVNKSATAGNLDSGVVSRKYDTTSLNGDYTISFQLRLENAAELNRIRLFDSTSSTLAPSSGASWYISAERGKNWMVYNGDKAVNTRVPLEEQMVYHFTIKIVSNTYFVTIETSDKKYSNATAALSFHSNPEVGGTLNFGLVPEKPASGVASSTFSLGSISVTQEIP